ncbi:MAG: phosphotransferase [Paenisporosarcina sp.]
MEQWIEDLFSQEVLNKAAAFFHADARDARKLGDFENYVYEVIKDGTPYILRLTHSSHRSKEEVEGELTWINFLHSHNIPVSLVHKSENNELVEVLPVSDSFFFVCLFDKAPGAALKPNSPEFGPELFYKWGAITAKMNRHTEDYPPNTGRKRWDEDDLIELDQFIDNEKDAVIIEGNRQLVNELKQLPETKDVFGLIHSDIHMGNFFYHEEQIHVFDFDDAMHFHYVSDIAIPLYYATWWKLRNETLETRSAFGTDFLNHFLKGYLSERPLPLEWLERLPLYLKLRDYTLYGVFHKKVDLANNEAENQLVAGIRKRIMNEELIVELDYKAIWEQANA